VATAGCTVARVRVRAGVGVGVCGGTLWPGYTPALTWDCCPTVGGSVARFLAAGNPSTPVGWPLRGVL
jgi:hypothetical protein